MRRREEEFERIALPYAPSLLRFAQRLTRHSQAAEDLVQDTLMQAWRRFHQLEAETHARAWLFRILMNAFRAGRRTARSRPEMRQLTPAAHAAPAPTVDSVEVAEALSLLAPEQRTALLLAAVEGFTCREISQILGVPIGTVMSRLSRGRQAMRASLPRGAGVAR